MNDYFTQFYWRLRLLQTIHPFSTSHFEVPLYPWGEVVNYCTIIYMLTFKFVEICSTPLTIAPRRLIKEALRSALIQENTYVSNSPTPTAISKGSRIDTTSCRLKLLRNINGALENDSK